MGETGNEAREVNDFFLSRPEPPLHWGVFDRYIDFLLDGVVNIRFRHPDYGAYGNFLYIVDIAPDTIRDIVNHLNQPGTSVQVKWRFLDLRQQEDGGHKHSVGLYRSHQKSMD